MHHIEYPFEDCLASRLLGNTSFRLDHDGIIFPKYIAKKRTKQMLKTHRRSLYHFSQNTMNNKRFCL